MKNNFRLTAGFFFVSTFLMAPTASALDVPLLTWEKGKSQSVVLGGGALEQNWKVYLKSSDSKLIELRPSVSNPAGFIVYSLNVPIDISNGAYSIITIGESSPETLVSAVEIIDMRQYEITRVPSDLLILILSLALWLSALGAMRGKSFRKVVLLTSTGPKERYLAGEPVEDFIEHVHKLNRFEKLRINIYEQLPDSFFKYLLKSESRGIHLEFPILWSLLPVLAIAFSCVLGYLTRNFQNLNVNGSNLALLILLVFIGSMDIYSGILGAMVFTSVRLWLFPEFAISSVVLCIVTSLVFFAPALITSYFTTLLRNSLIAGIQHSLSTIIFKWIFPVMILHTIFLIQRSINGSTESTFGIESLLAAAILCGRLIENYLSSSGLKWRNRTRLVEEFEINMGRLVSPGFVFSILVLLVIIFYSWTYSFLTAISLGAVVTFPLFLLVIRPTWNRFKFLGKIRRNPLVEIVIVSALTYGAFIGVQYLPYVAGTSAIQIILFGLSPVIVHALISFATDLSEREGTEEVL